MKRFVLVVSGFVLSAVWAASACAVEPGSERLAQTNATETEAIDTETANTETVNTKTVNTGATSLDAPTARQNLRIGTKEIVPFVFLDDEVPYGYSVELWNRMADDLGFQTEWVRYGSVSELLDGLLAGQVDAAIAGISITAKRESQGIDFSYPFYRSGLQLMVRTGTANPMVSMVSGLFSWEFWKPLLLVLATSAGVGVLVWMVEHENNEKFSSNPIDGIGQGIWFSIVTLGTFGYGDVTPNKLPGRIIAGLWMGASFFIVADFIASLTVGQMAASRISFDDLRGEKVGVADGTTAEEYVRSQPVKTAEFETLDEAIAALEAGDIEAVVHDYPTLKYIANRDADTFELAGKPLTQEDYGVAFREDSEMAELVSQEILLLQEQGYMRSLREKWFGSNQSGL